MPQQGRVLSGITRMSLTVSIIIVEITHDVRTLPLVMLSQAVASSVASRLAEPLEDSMIHLQGLPYLSEEPPSTFVDLTARDVMSPRVETLFEACTVQEILKLLRTNGHNGFPVVRSALAQPCLARQCDVGVARVRPDPRPQVTHRRL